MGSTRRQRLGPPRAWHALLVALALALMGAVVPIASAAGGYGASSRLERALAAWTAGHPRTGALVWRLGAGRPVPILAYKPGTPRLPASTMKLVTAAGALVALGPEFRFETRLFQGAGSIRRGHALDGPLYLKGYGDPVLATPQYAHRFLRGEGGNLGRLARPLVGTGVSLVRGPLVIDETFFDRMRTGPSWRSSYALECPPLSGLAVNQDYAGEWRSGNVKSPPRAAATRFRLALAALHVRVKGAAHPGLTPPSAQILGTVSSPPLRTIVGLMLPESDNFIAETLAKDIGAYRAGEGSTAAGTAQTTSLLSERALLDARDRIVDGSGLSRANRLTPRTLVRILADAAADRTWGPALVDGLARGGQGTLRHRLRSPRVAGRVRAKTGYISGAYALAGLVRSPSGARYAFAFLMNDGNVFGAHATQDALVTLLARGAGDQLPPVPS